MKSSRNIDFFISKFFCSQLIQINQIAELELGQRLLNLQLKFFQNVIKILQWKYQNNPEAKDILLNIVKASTNQENFEQISGNAMLLLNEIDPIQRGKNFSGIQLKNSNISNMKFYQCNFNNSQLDNVDISFTQFIQCQLQNVNWTNIKSSIVQIFNSHEPIVYFLTMSQSGTILASAHCKYIYLWKLQEGKQILRKKVSKQEQLSLSLSANGFLLAFIQNLISYCLLNTQLGKQIRKITGSVKYLHLFEISPDSQCLAFLHNKQIITLSSFKDGKELFLLKGHPDLIETIKFSQDSSILASACYIIILWNVQNGNIIWKFNPNSNYQSIYLTFAENDFIILSTANEVQLWNIQTKNIIKKISRLNDIDSAILQQSGQINALSLNQEKIELWNLKNKKELLVLRGHTKPVWIITTSADNKYLASGGDDSSIRVWKINELNKYFKKNQYMNHFQSNKCVALSYDNKILATSSDFSQSIILWSIQEGKEIETLVGHKNTVSVLAFQPNQLILASGSFDNTILLWCLIEKQILKQLIGHKKYVEILKFSKDGQLLVSCDNKLIILWNIKNGEQIHMMESKHNNSSIAFSNSNFFLAVGCDDGKFQLWNLTNGQLIEKQQIASQNDKIPDIIFLQDDQILAFGCNEHIRFWNINQKKETKSFKVRKEGITLNNIVFSEQIVAISDNSGTGDVMKLWSMKYQKWIYQLSGLTDKFEKMFFSHDNQFIVASFSDGSICLWNIEPFLEDEIQNLEKQDANFEQIDQIIYPYLILSQPQFRANYCNITQSQIISIDGFNLLSIFKYS